jgi:hypothetical protein
MRGETRDAPLDVSPEAKRAKEENGRATSEADKRLGASRSTPETESGVKPDPQFGNRVAAFLRREGYGRQEFRSQTSEATLHFRSHIRSPS